LLRLVIMGVHGLATYLRENHRALSTTLVLSQEQSKSKPALSLIIDGWSFIYGLDNQSRLPWTYGGEPEQFYDLVIRVARAWISVGWKLYFVFDGPYRTSKFDVAPLACYTTLFAGEFYSAPVLLCSHS